jgi:hypothetical protein
MRGLLERGVAASATIFQCWVEEQVLEIYGEHLRKQKMIPIVLAKMQLELIDGVILFRKRFHVAR